MRAINFCAACLILLIWASVAVAQSNGYEITELGFTGPNYEYVSPFSGGGIVQFSEAEGMNSQGQVIGTSSRFDSSGDSLGQDAWLFSDGRTIQLGFVGSVYSIPFSGSSGGTFEDSSVSGINNSGQVVGTTDRWSSAGADLGQDAWIFNGSATEQIGFTGGVYSYTGQGTDGEAFQYSTVNGINQAGQAFGTSEPIVNTLNGFGRDAWYFDGTSTQQIGLVGTNYSYTANVLGVTGTREFSQGESINSSGEVLGLSQRGTAQHEELGTDVWIFQNGTTKQIGLTGSNYGYAVSASNGDIFEYSTAFGLNDAGYVLGTTNRCNTLGADLGNDAWIYNGVITQPIGLTGPNYSYTSTEPGGGTYQESQPVEMNDSEHVIGESTRFNTAGSNLGYDAWLSTGSSIQQIGLTGGIYSYSPVGVGGGTYQISYANEINDHDQVLGNSRRYSPSGVSLGGDAWFFDGKTTREIGLTGANYTYTIPGQGNYQASGTTALNNAGQAVGVSHRYDASGDSLGQAGWFFDPKLGTTTELVFSTDTEGDAMTQPDLLTDSGVVLGTFDVYSGSADLRTDLFYWSESAGFYDLGSLVAGGLSERGWQSLADLYGSATPGVTGTFDDTGLPQYILGDGYVTGEAGPYPFNDPPPNYNNSVFLLTVVPEPSAAALLTMGALGTLIRPRRIHV